MKWPFNIQLFAGHLREGVLVGVVQEASLDHGEGLNVVSHEDHLGELVLELVRSETWSTIASAVDISSHHWVSVHRKPVNFPILLESLHQKRLLVSKSLLGKQKLLLSTQLKHITLKWLLSLKGNQPALTVILRVLLLLKRLFNSAVSLTWKNSAAVVLFLVFKQFLSHFGRTLEVLFV